MAQKLDSGTSPKNSVVVIGGGLAGIAAACRLVDNGHTVTLVEKLPFLGGRASSFRDPESGVQVDNGQHVFLRRCTAFIELLEKLGTLHLTHIQPRLCIKVAGPGGRIATLSTAPLPTPLHLLPSFLSYSHLNPKEKLQAIYAMLHARLTDHRRPELEQLSFYEWLKRKHQSQRTVENFWDLIILAALNGDSKNVSAAMGLMVFREALLKGRHGADIGYAITGLSEALGDASQEYLQSRGGQLLLGRGISKMTIQAGRVAGLQLDDGESLLAKWYISALPYHVLMTLLPDEVTQEPFFSRLGGLSSAPIINLHVWYDRPVMDDEFVAFVGSPLQWVFNKSRMQGKDESYGQYLAISLSGAGDYIQKPDEELQETFLPELAQAFPKAKEAKVTRFLVSREKRATFRPLPGTANLRPSTTTSVNGLLLAGDWTNTGWPSTMEGAVLSGNSAAEAIIRGGNE